MGFGMHICAPWDAYMGSGMHIVGSGMHAWALGCIFGLWDAYMIYGMHAWALKCIYGLWDACMGWDAYLSSGMHIWAEFPRVPRLHCQHRLW